MSTDPTAHPSTRAGWLYSQALWGSLSIMAMWLVVLLVGIFGDDFVVNNSNGFTKIPVVVFLLPFVLPGTIVIGRRAFTRLGAVTTPTRNSEAQTPDVESAEPPALHAKAA